MQLLALLASAFLSCGCQASGQSLGELVTPDELHVFGSVGDGDIDGEWRSPYRAHPIESDLDQHALGLSLGWDLTAGDAQAQRETARALHALAARLDGLQLARAQVEPEKCGEPTPQEGQDEDHATPDPDGEGPQGEEPADLEGVLYAVAALATAIAGYLGRKKIPGVRSLHLPKRKAKSKAGESAGGDPPLA